MLDLWQGDMGMRVHPNMKRLMADFGESGQDVSSDGNTASLLDGRKRNKSVSPRRPSTPQ
jgi:hypothetical protein